MWIQSVAKWISRLYTFHDSTRVPVLLSWLQNSRGWFRIADTFPIPPYKTHEGTRIAKTDTLEIWVLSWAANSVVSTQNRLEGGCWFKVVDGTLYECVNGAIRTLRTGDVGYVENWHENHTLYARWPAKTIHIYAPSALV